MTKRSVEPGDRGNESTPTRCAWCSRGLPDRPHNALGRRPIYCRRSCRQRAYESRQRAASLGLGDDELIVTRNELDDANDRLFEIRQLIADAQRDLNDGIKTNTVVTRLIDGIDSVVGSN